jgi:Tfp pilus assembly protein FimT
LAVIAIISVMAVLLAPALSGIRSASDLTRSAYDIKGILDQSRAYAMANNTYVFVGLAEVDASQADTSTPQKAGVGRLAIAVAASQDGTLGYDRKSTSISSPAISSSKLTAVSKLQRFENIHLTDLGATPPATGGMARPAVSDPNYRLGTSDAASHCVTPFNWPLSSAGNPQYSFKIVLNFDPQGAARIQGATNTDYIPRYIEIGLQPANGNAVSSGANTAAIQIDGMTGSSRIYRP